MGYKKIWTPPGPIVRDNLDSWKSLFLDFHQNLLLAGLQQTSTPGQLDIESVAVLPTDGSYAGFIEYAFMDALQSVAPIVLKIEYGCGIEGLDIVNSSMYRSSRQPRIRCTVLFNGVTSDSFACPQSHNSGSPALTNSNTKSGISYVCNSPERGFFGIVYGAGSRGTWSGGYKPYSAATFSLFVQRSLDSNGSPNGDSVALYYNGFNTSQSSGVAVGLWFNSKLLASISEYLPSHANSISRSLARRIGAPLDVKSADAELLLEPIYYSSPGLKQFPYLYSYHYQSLAEGGQFPLEIYPGVELNFIALGRETCMVPDDFDAQNAGLVMLFDEN